MLRMLLLFALGALIYMAMTGNGDRVKGFFANVFESTVQLEIPTEYWELKQKKNEIARQMEAKKTELQQRYESGQQKIEDTRQAISDLQKALEDVNNAISSIQQTTSSLRGVRD